MKAVIFDFFGVLATRGLREYKKKYLGSDEGKRAKAKELQQELDSGRLGYDGFIGRLSEVAGTDINEVLKYSENYKPNAELLSFIREDIKPRYKVGIVSNSGSDWVQKILGVADMELFDDITLSFKVRQIKPHPDIYKISAANLGVSEEQCVFVDDILTYCEGAESTRMKAVWYQNFEQMKKELDRALSKK